MWVISVHLLFFLTPPSPKLTVYIYDIKMQMKSTKIFLQLRRNASSCYRTKYKPLCFQFKFLAMCLCLSIISLSHSHVSTPCHAKDLRAHPIRSPLYLVPHRRPPHSFPYFLLALGSSLEFCLPHQILNRIFPCHFNKRTSFSNSKKT